jgi:hypothetical protein
VPWSTLKVVTSSVPPFATYTKRPEGSAATERGPVPVATSPPATLSAPVLWSMPNVVTELLVPAFVT